MSPPRLVRLAILVLLVACVLVYPAIMVFVGLHRPGLNLTASLDAGFSLTAFKSVLWGDAQAEIRFRESFARGVTYAALVGLAASTAAFFYTIWACGKRKADSMKVSFTLLTLAVLPQTYLILPVLVVWPFATEAFGQALRIMVVELLGLLPLAAWLLYLLNEEEQRKVQAQCAVDGLSWARAARQVLGGRKVQMIAVVLLSAAIAWGNFLVPYSLGSSSTSTPTVQIATFTSHLGRDWARICAAGSIVLVPGFFLAGLILVCAAKTLVAGRGKSAGSSAREV